MDTQGPDYVDPADQWVLDPATGTYQLRLDPMAAAVPEPGPPSPPPPPPVTVPEPVPPAPGVPSAAGAPAAGDALSGRGARADRGGRRGAPPSNRRRRKAKKAGGRGALLWTAIAVAVAVVAVAVVRLASGGDAKGVSTVDAGNAGAGTLSSSGPMNLLLIGATDEKDGAADATVLLHVAADRGDATALSIPRDLVTAIPDCPAGGSGGTRLVPGSPLKAAGPVVADSLGTGGRDASCTMRVVKQLTGLPVDHVVQADPAAVKALSTALGGISLCLAHPVTDPASRLDLGSGPHKVEGDQALGLLRAPGRAETDRVPVQQGFLAALIRAARTGSADAAGRKALAGTAAGVLTVDTPLGSADALDRLAADLGKVDPRHITLTTLPVKANPGDPSHDTVVVDQAQASQVLALIKNDVSFSRGPVPPDPRLVGPRTTAHNTRVEIYNGSGIFGASQDVLAWLQNEQHADRTTNGGDAPAHTARTTLRYAPNQADQARSLAAMLHLPASALVLGTKDAAPKANMTLTLGADYTAPGVPIGPPSAPPKGLRMTTADSTACFG